MAQKDRLERIRQMVRLEKKVIVTDLSDQFDVAPETIRRDLEKLAEEGLVVRTYGGAVLNQVEPVEKIDFLKRSKTNVEEKRTIGLLAAAMVPMNASIGCDASSTVMEALNCLSERDDILVLTNSVKVVREMEMSRYGILLTGGMVNRQSYSMQGGVARSTIQEYHLDLVMLSCKGIGSEGGVFDSHELEADVKKTLLERGRKVMLLADHTKLGRVAFMKLTDLEAIDVIVTDRKPSDEWLRLFGRYNIEVCCP